jgi:putative membrane protein
MLGWHWSWWAWSLMTVAMVAGWGAVLWLLAGLGHPDPPQEEDGAEGVLADRLARGEIDVDEYQRRIDALHGEAQAGVR